MNETWLNKARELEPIVARYRDESERERRLVTPLFQALWEPGLLSLLVPRELGGSELDLTSLCRMVEEISRQDGAVGWNFCVLNGNALLAEYLPADGAAEVFGPGDALIAGSFAPKGQAEAVQGGHRVSGQWPFASGSANATWFMATAPVAGETPEPRVFVLPAAEVNVLDTWHTAGLRGTGSTDIVLEDVFVPSSRSVPLSMLATGPGAGAIHKRSFQDYGAPLLASVALGIARAAIEAFKALAPSKTPVRSPSVLSQRQTAQQKLGYAEGLVRSARAHLFDVLGRLDGPEDNSPSLSNASRLASTSTVESAIRAVDLVFELAGGTSIYEASPLERCWRDVHVVSHHAVVSPNIYETIGASLLSATDSEPQPDDPWLKKVRELEPIVSQYRDESERGRHLPAPVHAAMQERGLFGMLVSKAFGGSQATLESAVRVVEEISRYDGATGWNACIGIGGALMADYLPEEHARAVFGAGVAAGSFAPGGRAVPVEGGYRVTGQWPFASGCHNATSYAAGCLIMEEGTPRLLPNGAPDVRILFMPASDCSIVDTWTSVGLRGTGSHDIAAQDVFVPEGRHVSFPGMRQPAPERASRAYATSFFANQGPILSAVALGIARDAIDAFHALATAKTPRGGSISLAEQPTVQEAFARAEALLRSARAYVYEVTREADACDSPEKANELAATMRLAGAQATANAIEAVDLMYDWAGTSSVYTPNRIERCWRDVHVVSHHINIATVSFEMVGQYLLGGPLAQRR